MVWYIDHEISVTAPMLLPWLLIGVNTWFKEVKQMKSLMHPSVLALVVAIQIEYRITGIFDEGKIWQTD